LPAEYSAVLTPVTSPGERPLIAKTVRARSAQEDAGPEFVTL
jgi:hypothetical protein